MAIATEAMRPPAAGAQRVTLDPSWRPDPPDISHIVTEDDEPVENWYSEKVQRLLTSTLYASWAGLGEGRPFIAAANVGIFYGLHDPPIVPDVFVSCDVERHEDVWEKRHRTYFIWEFGKAPELVVEIVSNRKGGEDTRKRDIYARIGIPYYVVYDPTLALKKGALRVFELRGGGYVARRDHRLPRLGLGLVEWDGTFEEWEATWLRWTDGEGQLLRTTAERADSERGRADSERERADSERERADSERERADSERERADSERERADSERERAERLAAKLRELGLDPDAI